MAGHLKYSAGTGHLLHSAAGHLVNECEATTTPVPPTTTPKPLTTTTPKPTTTTTPKPTTTTPFNWCERYCDDTYYVDISATCLDVCVGTFTLAHFIACQWSHGHPLVDRCVAGLIHAIGPPRRWVLTISDEQYSNSCSYRRLITGEDCPEGVYTRIADCGDCPETVTVYT